MSVECAGVGTAAGIGIDDGHMAKGAGKLMNLRGVICSIAEIVKAVLDESFAFLHQGNGGLAVVKGSVLRILQIGMSKSVEAM